jgi:hypothetical protein
MWCESCQADVAAELTADHRRLQCTRCTADLGATIVAPRPSDPRSDDLQREARELLSRWSTEALLDALPQPALRTAAVSAEPLPRSTLLLASAEPSATTVALSTSATSVRTPTDSTTINPGAVHQGDNTGANETRADDIRADESRDTAASNNRAATHRRLKWRIDAGEPRRSQSTSESSSANDPVHREPAPTPPPARRQSNRSDQTVNDHRAASDRQPGLRAEREPRPKPGHSHRQPTAPTRATSAANATLPARSSEPAAASRMLGLLSAYLGILVLTAGTAVVLWSYFGNHPQFAPTGWLIGTVGQMLLLLGVVTLVSSGLEQTTAAVAREIDRLNGEYLRIEAGHRRSELPGPHYLRRRRHRRSETGRRFDPPDAAAPSVR